MSTHPYLPEELDGRLARAVRVQWATIFLMLTIVLVMGLAMGSSRAMRTALFEDLLGLVPPISFLVALRWERKPPSPSYPYGFLNAATIAFSAASFALLAMGGWLLWKAAEDLVTGRRPSIGAVEVAGHATWAGWWMLGAVAYSAVPPFVLGRIKLRLAEELNDDTLSADADMNKADWQTALATGLGVLGIGVGWWWADALAAGAISLSILRDGLGNVRRVFQDLTDHAPVDVKGEPAGLSERMEAELRPCPWIADVAVRLREEGRFVIGDVRFVPTPDRPPAPHELAAARDALRRLDWRVHDLSWTPLDGGAAGVGEGPGEKAPVRPSPPGRRA